MTATGLPLSFSKARVRVPQMYSRQEEEEEEVEWKMEEVSRGKAEGGQMMKKKDGWRSFRTLR